MGHAFLQVKPMRKFKITFIVDGVKQTPYCVDSPNELQQEMEEVFGCSEWTNDVYDWALLAEPGDKLVDDDDVHIMCV